MIEEKYKKGNRLVIIGFSLAYLSILVPLFITGGDKSAQLTSGQNLIISLCPFLNLVGSALFIYGSSLLLKSKNRSLWWLLLLIPLNVIGAVIFYFLKDRSVPIPATKPV